MTPIPLKLLTLSEEFGENSLVPADSFKTRVFLGEKFVFKVSEQNIEDSKENKILGLLQARLSEDWKKVIPKVVETRYVEELGFVQVQERLVGAHPVLMNAVLAQDLGKFLKALHSSGTFEFINEFDEKPEISFNDYLRTGSLKFLSVLEKVVSNDDLLLLQNAVGRIKQYLGDSPTDPKLVLIHKDIHLQNLLVDENNNLTGVVDWGAAQTGPVEWEFAILLQRMPEYYNQILESYGESSLESTVLDVCGLIQSMRFWKSFPEDVVFVEEQRGYIKEILKI